MCNFSPKRLNKKATMSLSCIRQFSLLVVSLIGALDPSRSILPRKKTPIQPVPSLPSFVTLQSLFVVYHMWPSTLVVVGIYISNVVAHVCTRSAVILQRQHSPQLTPGCCFSQTWRFFLVKYLPPSWLECSAATRPSAQFGLRRSSTM